MRICLINPPHEESLDRKLDPPLSLMYIASSIREIGIHDVSIVDLAFYDRNEWKKMIPKADLYGITAMTSSLHHAMDIKFICKCIKPKCTVMVGGAHPSALPVECQNLGFDITVVGEAEGVIRYILDHFDYLIEDKHIIYGKKYLMDIDKIPFPARDLVPIKEYTRLVNGIKATSIIASRGCPYKCAFCINSTKKIFNKPRYRTTENIIAEMKEVIEKYNFKAFIFYDDTFTIHPELDKLLNEIKKLNIIFRCNGNARKDTFETFQKLYDAGCREISFGIESGSPKILKMINKNVTPMENYNAISSAKSAGLIVKAFLMVGSPGETRETVESTINFINFARPNQWTLFNFVPLPGCDIYNNPKKYGIKIITKDYKQYYNIAGQNEGGITCETEHMTAEDIRKARQYMIDNLMAQEGLLQEYYNKLKNKPNKND